MLHFRINSDIISVTTIDNSIRFGFAQNQGFKVNAFQWFRIIFPVNRGGQNLM
jgi:hypothetical protein